MNVKAFQNKSNLSILFAEVLNESGEGACCKESSNWVRNPRSLQLTPDPSNPKNVVPNLYPVFYTEIMTVDDYDTEFSGCDFMDITERFGSEFFDLYRKLEGDVEDIVDGTDGGDGGPQEPVKIFES